jgi:enterochelin esterase-like enzyme
VFPGLRFLLVGITPALVAVLAQNATAPIVEGRDVTFVAAGEPSDPPRIVADFNGWDPAAGTMTRGSDGVYRLSARLDPAARIEYLIAYRDRFEVDPRNPLHVPAPTGALRSELRMPGYRPPPAPKASAPGVTDTIPFTSRSGEPRRIQVHRPRHAEGPLPILFVHDGEIAVDRLEMPAMIDALVEAGKMAPITAVFIDSVDRHEDYAVGSMFSFAFASEIVPAMERRYPIVAGARAVLGFSRSTVGALDAALNASVAFSRCGLVAPAMDEITRRGLFQERSGPLPVVTILAGTYDIPLIEDAKALRGALEAGHATIDWFEIPQGHNHTAWKELLPKLLTSWYPR